MLEDRQARCSSAIIIIIRLWQVNMWEESQLFTCYCYETQIRVILWALESEIMDSWLLTFQVQINELLNVFWLPQRKAQWKTDLLLISWAEFIGIILTKLPQWLKINSKDDLCFPILSALDYKTKKWMGMLLIAADSNFWCRPLLCYCIYMTMILTDRHESGDNIPRYRVFLTSLALNTICWVYS